MLRRQGPNILYKAPMKVYWTKPNILEKNSNWSEQKLTTVIVHILVFIVLIHITTNLYSYCACNCEFHYQSAYPYQHYLLPITYCLLRELMHLLLHPFYTYTLFFHTSHFLLKTQEPWWVMVKVVEGCIPPHTNRQHAIVNMCVYIYIYTYIHIYTYGPGSLILIFRKFSDKIRNRVQLWVRIWMRKGILIENACFGARACVSCCFAFFVIAVGFCSPSDNTILLDFLRLSLFLKQSSRRET